MASHGRGTDFSIQDHYGNYRVSRVNLRLYLVFPISPLPLLGFWTYLVLTESHSPGESNAIGFKKFGSGIPHKEGANIRQYARVEQFRDYPTSSASSAPNFLKPMALDSPGEWLSVSTSYVQNPMSGRGDIGKTRWSLKLTRLIL